MQDSSHSSASGSAMAWRRNTYELAWAEFAHPKYRTMTLATLIQMPHPGRAKAGRRPRQALVLMGGGARTAYQAGVLRGLAKFEAEAREQAGKGAARATRRQGLVPAVIYGAKQEATLIALDPRDVMKEMHKGGWQSHLYEVAVKGGGTERTLLDRLKKDFEKVRHFKPEASRADSARSRAVTTSASALMLS